MFEHTAWTVYWYLTLGKVATTLAIISGIAIVIMFVGVFIAAMEDERGIAKRIAKLLSIPFFILFITLFYPSVDNMKVILGGSTAIVIGSSVADAEGADKIPQNVVNAVNTFLEKIDEEHEAE